MRKWLGPSRESARRPPACHLLHTDVDRSCSPRGMHSAGQLGSSRSSGQPLHHALSFSCSMRDRNRRTSPCRPMSIVATSAGRNSSAPRPSPSMRRTKSEVPQVRQQGCVPGTRQRFRGDVQKELGHDLQFCSRRPRGSMMWLVVDTLVLGFAIEMSASGQERQFRSLPSGRCFAIAAGEFSPT